MRSRAWLLLGALGVASIGCFVFWSNSKNDILADRREKLSEELKEMKARFDQPAEASAYHVNRRTGGWVQSGARGASQTAIGTPLDPNLYLAAIEQANAMNRYSTATNSIMPSLKNSPININAPAGGTLGTWSPLGPTNQGGRTRQLLINPTNASIMYAAAVGGGVWKTTDGGANWVPMTDLAIPNIAVTALVFDPSNYNKIYAGTGEGFFNGDALRGAGIFVTLDAGSTWSRLASTDNTNFQYVMDIVVSPRNPQRVYAATRTGVFRSNDGGGSWTSVATGTNGCSDLALQMNRSIAYVYASCGLFTTTGDVKRALDGPNTSFTQVFTTANMSRSSLAIAPSNESTIYILASNGAANAYQHGVLGVYRSTANGAAGTWTTQMSNNLSTVDPVPLNNVLLTNPVFSYNSCVGSSRGFFNQGWYDQVIAVDPADSNRVWVGGIDLFRSDDGGANFGIASYWWFNQGDANYSHADQHVISFHPGYNGTSNRIMFNANDGGIFRTNDARAAVGTNLLNVCSTVAPGAVTWTELNNNYTTTQFYHGSPYPDGTSYIGGTQDNGTWRGSTGSSVWSKLLGGDGGYTGVDTKPVAANNVLFGEYTRLSIQKSTNNGASFFNAISGITESAGNFLFINPFHMNPGNRQHLWTGGFFIWRTINQASNWTQASAITPGALQVSAISASSADPNKVVFGMADGFIGFNTAAVTASSATAWAFTQPRTVTVTSLAYDPNNSNNVWATYGTFSGTSVYKSTNSGATWTAASGTVPNVLPAVPALTVIVDPTNSNRVYVGTDIGVFTTIDGGANWYKEVTGFANVAVEWLDINSTGTRQLYAFTHGRGTWRVNLIP